MRSHNSTAKHALQRRCPSINIDRVARSRLLFLQHQHQHPQQTSQLSNPTKQHVPAVTGPTVLGVISGTISVLSFLFSLFPNTNKDGTVVRLQLGLDTPGGLDGSGGHVPFITTYNANFDAIEHGNPRKRTCITSPGGGSTCYNSYDKVKEGSYVDVTLTMSAGHEGQQPVYIDLQQIGGDKGKGDAICLAVLALLGKTASNMLGWATGLRRVV